ncbi:MAG TPA: succinate dehydrogenase cytochrome b subunit [Opitutaceae bacterium]|nr:succinate dehydrogenase cytochrome b subunit [Opitutaceae bacterium]
MNPVGFLFRSSIGRKILLALTGIVLIGFVIVHLVGNLQVFSTPDAINGYAYFLHATGPSLWVGRIFLIVSVAIHIWAATVLTLENRRARGDGPRYGVNHTVRATLASRTMRWTGYIVLAFVIYHLAHFTVGAAQKETFKDSLKHYTMVHDYGILGIPAVRAGTDVPDVHSMVILGFQNVAVSIFYIIAVGLLSFHLLHGLESLFQTLGLRSNKWARALRLISIVFCTAYFLGNLAIPGAVLLGKLQPRPEVRAAALVAR